MKAAASRVKSMPRPHPCSHRSAHFPPPPPVGYPTHPGPFPGAARTSLYWPLESLATPTSVPHPYIRVFPWLSPHQPGPTPTCHCPGPTIPGPDPIQSNPFLALAAPWLHLSPEGPFPVLTHACLSSSPTSWPHRGPGQSPPCQAGILSGEEGVVSWNMELGHGYSYVRGQVHG